ncbi:acyl-CoA dehydrogenase [Bdellovibrio bacteriovorus]|uniref:Acyl-coenzyme A dehydrogenase n=1 Tax=Bdellovibrio bacteriovorus TaxID=959 RepID=A0A161PRQ4_BDEBC|nr:acyl-CoA dehydrogenase [Bdellovibrio bacteriovorus]KYG65118.1 acyl-CoA dehydrogenase [Bdellovibrio bacteriovorus]
MDSINSLYGFFLESCTWAWVLGSVALLLFVGFFGSPLIVWTIALAAILFGFGAPTWLWIVFAVLAVIFNIPPIRAALVTSGVFGIFKKFEFLPKISDTEKAALDAGVVWVEKDLFSGKPNFTNLMNEPYPSLTAEEKAFMDGPVNTLCAMIDHWQIYKTKEIPQDIWDYIRKEKFLGMIVPKEYGGLGFSALCHSEVIMKLSSRSISVAIQVMVPNSLGPAELLAHYGTDKQKDYWLPRLADGREIPCFGLTEPTAGSDAGAITSTGILFKDTDGKIKIKLNWNKRWITLAAISSVIGLAFRLRDPENLLGKGEDVGITCALIPSKTPGVVLGRRHDPLNTPFYNCPTQGKDVVVDAEEAIVGGIGGAGRGWMMLMECLAAGRGISLPAQATGGAKLATRVTSAHSVVRRQFGVSIGKFEGVEEPLARIGASTYALEAMRIYTLGALDKGIKPGVITAMQKYYSTEMGRKSINDAMDIMGGAGISMGPRNVLAEIYIATPIGITVEGANIMTRTLIIFGQGALRAHPFAYAEVKAYEANDLKAFDKAFFGHIGHIVRNTCRAILLSLSRGYLAATPDCHPQMKIYFRRLSWTSATYALLADVAMGVLGGSLKMREKITGRFADILANMYIATSILRRFEAEGRREEDLAFVHYNLKYNMAEIQKGFDGIFDNLKIPGLRWFFKGWIGAWSRINSIGSQASDGWSHAIASAMMKEGGIRDRLTAGIYMPTNRNDQLGRLEYAMSVTLQAEAAEKKIKKAIRDGALPKKKAHLLLDEAKGKNIITEAEYKLMQEAEPVRYDAILVDDFSEEQYHANKVL